MPKHVVLIGMSGSGKTTIGRILARKLGRPFLDMDREIEARSQLSVSEIFLEHGEAAFRQMETELLSDLNCLRSATVVASGGGIVERPENLQLLRQLGYVFWLRMTPEALVWRLRHTRRQDRPLLMVPDWPDVVYRMTARREPLYQQVVDVSVQVDTLSPEQAADLMARTLRTIEGRR